MRLTFTSVPETGPLLLDEIRAHLKMDATGSDTDLAAIAAAAAALLEQHTGLVLISRQASLYLDDWPTAMGHMPWWQGVAAGSMAAFTRTVEYLSLPVRPVTAIEAVTTFDNAGGETVWSPSSYGLTPGLEPGIYRKGASWPAPGRRAEGIRIDLTAGFGESWNDIPADIRQALLMLVTSLFENRGDTGADPIRTSGVHMLLAPYRRKRL